MSQFRVWGAAFASLLAWIMMGIIAHRDERFSFAIFAVASTVIFVSLLCWKPVNVKNSSKEDIWIVNEDEARVWGASVFWKVLHEIVAQDNLPTCPLAIICHTPVWQAFMLNRKNNRYFGVLATTGIIERLSELELKAVVAHEIAHADDVYDGERALFIIDFVINSLKCFGHALLIIILISLCLCEMGFVDVSVDLVYLAIVYWCSLLFGYLWGPSLHALVMQEREIRADARGSEKMGSVEPLIKALTKIDSPRKEKTFLRAMLTQEENTHPVLEERIKHLRRIQKT